MILWPVFHVITCTLYIYGYSSGFGSSLSAFFSISDFFTITLQHLISIYFGSFFLPLLLIYFRHRNGYISFEEELTQKGDPDPRATSRRIQKIILIALLIACLSISLTTYVIYEQLKYVDFALVAAVLQLSIVFPYWKLCDAIRLSGMPADLGWLSIAFTIGVFFNGYNDGEKHRIMDVKSFSDNARICKDYIILTPISGKYLVIFKDGTRKIIDSDCKSQIEFSKF